MIWETDVACHFSFLPLATSAGDEGLSVSTFWGSLQAVVSIQRGFKGRHYTDKIIPMKHMQIFFRTLINQKHLQKC